jgi:uncharacterized protein YgiM (DUF1202 family)
MDFYLTSLQSGDRLRFPILPDRLNVKTGAMVVALNIIKTGEVRIPRGSTLTGYSWNGTFPGEGMYGLPFVFDWQPPARIIELLCKWEAEGQTLRFMVTDLSVNVDVFIEAFTYDYYGIGNVSYTLNLTTRKELTVTTVPAPTTPSTPDDSSESDDDSSKTYGIVKVSSRLNVRQKASTSSKILGKLKNGTRVEILGKTGNWYIIPYSSGTNGKAYVYKSYVKLESQSSGGSSSSGSSGGSSGSSGSSSSGSYKVKSEDTLYLIAKAMLGDGRRWLEIYNLNKSAIDAANKGKTVSKYTVYAGMSLKLPAKKTSTKKTTSSSTLASTVKSVVSKVTTAVKSVVTTKPTSTLVKAASTAVKTVTSVVSKIASLFKK